MLDDGLGQLVVQSVEPAHQPLDTLDPGPTVVQQLRDVSIATRFRLTIGTLS